MNKEITFFGNYTYNHSTIRSFDVGGYVAKDLQGKFLIDVPQHQIYSGFIMKSKWANLSLTYKYKSMTWADDENTMKVKGYALVDGKVSRRIADKVDISLTMENIFNAIYLNSKYQLPSGEAYAQTSPYRQPLEAG